MLHRFLILFLLSPSLSIIAPAQEVIPSGPSNSSEYSLFTGGQLGLNFGSITQIEASPILGCYISPYFSLGIGAGYLYYNDRSMPSYGSLSLGIFSMRTFARIHPIDPVFGYAEFEQLRYKNKSWLYPQLPDGETLISNNLLIGVGYMEMISDYFGSYFMILYNLNENIYTPYTNPVVRVGIEIGL